MKKYFKESWINNNLIVYIEKHIFHSIDNKVIMQRSQNMKTYKRLLNVYRLLIFFFFYVSIKV